ncbi:MAG: hypothetical protein J6Y82_10035 [Bacteroidales bacterium]|nr:hypothetical protein [Bacteroidales bacterium]
MNVSHYIITLFAFLSAMGIASAQEQPDSIIKYNADGVAVARSYFKYDDNKRQTLAMHYVFNQKNEEWAGTSRDEMTFDNNGNCLSKSTLYWDYETRSWVVNKKQESAYDSRGRVIGHSVMNWNKVRKVWVGETKTETEFNNMGLHASETSYFWDDNATVWIKDRKQNFTYDDRGRCTLCETQKWVDGKAVNESRIEYTFDANSRDLLLERLSVWDKGNWVLSTETKYTFGKPDDSGCRSKETIVQTASNGTLTNSRREVVTLDANNVEIFICREEWNGSKWLINSQDRKEIKYDEDKNRIFEESYSWIGQDKWVGVTHYEAKFNDYGDVVTEKRMKWNAQTNSWAGVSYVNYEYDGVGNIIRDERFKWDSKAGEWINQSVNEIEYDEYHNKKAESTSSWNKIRQTWENFYKGKFEYAYDGDGNMKIMEEYVWDVKKWKIVSTVNYF